MNEQIKQKGLYMDISRIVSEGLPVGSPSANADNKERFYYTIATLLFAGKCREEEPSVTVSKQDDGEIIAVSSPTTVSIKLPYEWKEIVAWSAEASEYGAWAEPDLRERTSPKFIFTASKTKTVYQAMNFVRMHLKGYGDTLTFTEQNHKLFCKEEEGYVEGISLEDLKEVRKDRSWLDSNRITTSSWREGQWKEFIYFRMN